MASYEETRSKVASLADVNSRQRKIHVTVKTDFELGRHPFVYPQFDREITKMIEVTDTTNDHERKVDYYCTYQNILHVYSRSQKKSLIVGRFLQV